MINCCIRQTLIISAFCGTGKTYLCENSNKKIVEFECWKYDKDCFPDNYVSDIQSKIGQVDIIFISTNPLALNILNKLGIKIILIYPQLELKNEYIERYKNRGSATDFILTLSKYWDSWLEEIKENKYCKHVELKSDEYVSTILSQDLLDS